MTGGVIRDCKGWNDRAWLSSVGITRDDAMTNSSIWQWEGEDLRINGYPAEHEISWRLMSRGGKMGMKKRWKNSKKKESENKGVIKGVIKGG
jgi:hypothetical protein